MTTWSWAPELPSTSERRRRRFVAFAPYGVGFVLVLLFATGRWWAAFAIGAGVLGLSQARSLSPAFARRFDAGLGRVALALGSALGTGLSWLLLGTLYVLVFIPAAVLSLLFRRGSLGRPRGLVHAGWIPRHALVAAPAPERGFGAEPGRVPGARPPLVLRVTALLAVVVIVDLAAGAILAATGVLPSDRGRIGEDVRDAVTSTMDAPAIRDEPWADQFGQDMANFELGDDHYLPFLVRGHHAFASPHLNTTDQERLSYEPRVTAGVEPLRIAFFGGSVMFGVGQRDGHTIPSAFARIAEAEGVPVEVHNHGFPGWVSWQGMTYLERLLAAGERYDMVVFFDGFNDFHVQSVGFSSDPTHVGASQLDAFASDFHTDQEVPEGFFDGLNDLAETYGENSAVARLVDRLDGEEVPSIVGPLATPEEQADAALDIYERATGRVRDLVDAYGSSAAFFWQPRRIGWPSEVTDRLPAGVADLGHVFDGQEDELYIDEVHTNEHGAQVVAEAMWAELAAELERLLEGDSG